MNNKKWLIPTGIISLAWLPVIFASRYYMDDLGRSVRGYYDWSPNGRPVAEAIFRAITLNNGMFDISPLYQVMSFFIMGICCLLLIKSLRLEISTNNLIISSLLFLMPFYLENISYRYDSLTMALSCLMALCSYHLARNKPGYSWMALSLALGVLYLSTYQTFISVFVIVSMLSVIKSDSLLEGIKQEIKPGISFALSYIIYSKFVAPLYITGQYNITHSQISFDINLFRQNLTGAFEYLKSITGNYELLVFVANTAFIVFLLLTNAGRKNRVKSAFDFAIVALAVLVPVLIYLPLNHPVFFPRVFVGFGCVVAATALVLGAEKYAFSRYLVLINLVVALVLSLAYNRASDSMNQNDQSLVSAIQQKASANDSIVVFGSQTRDAITKRLAESFPVIKVMTPLYLNNENWWGKLLLNKYGINNQFLTSRADREAHLLKACSISNGDSGVYKRDGFVYVMLDGAKCN
ncbi:TPA: glucosyltransferase domain-containing protein [Escherichia coli]